MAGLTIPLIVCKLDEPRWLLLAGVIVAASIVLGAVAAPLTRPLPTHGRWAAFVVLGCLFPATFVLGVWPFDPRWNFDCGFTPDPNLRVALATLAFPLIFPVSAWAAHRIRTRRA